MFENLRKAIKECPNILITAGAGMGVDSGLPDFRGEDGFWKAYPPLKKLGIDFANLANITSFLEKPELVWAFYLHRQKLYQKTNPHYGFELLRDLVSDKDYFILTSNVDEAFQKAGFEEAKIYECHGNINYFQCLKGCSDLIWRNEVIDEIDMNDFRVENPPICPLCKRIARPNIVLFSDWTFNDSRIHKQEYQFRKWVKSKEEEELIIIEIGAGLHISTIRNWGEKIAKENSNAKLIRINPKECKIDDRLGVGIKMRGLEALKLLLEP